MNEPDARILGVSSFLAAIPDGEGSILAAAGGFGVTDHDRIGLITLDGEVRILEDAYLPARDLDELVSAIAHKRPKSRARKGGWNTLFATGWSLAWTDDPGPFLVIGEKGRLAWVEDDQLHTQELALPRPDIAAVEPFVSENWVTRGVRVRMRSGERHVIASEDDQSPVVVPFYDGLNLMAETFWCHGLARALSRGLGPAVVDCT
jgi:hypothetical protein